MAAAADELSHKRQASIMLATDIINRDSNAMTGDKRRHAIAKLAGDLLLSGELQESAAVNADLITIGTTTNADLIRGVAKRLHPSARQRFVERSYVDGHGQLLVSEQKRLRREVAEARQTDMKRQFAKQRAVVDRGASVLASHQKNRGMHTPDKMPARTRTTRKPAAKMWVTPSGRVTTMAAHRKRSAAARSAVAWAAWWVAPAPTCRGGAAPS
jgi:hypothetical protein